MQYLQRMKTLIFTIIVAISSSFSACLSQSVPEMPAVPVAKGEKRAVLVELFTSEGCSSCPPADKVLMTLQNDQLVPNADVITLGFHVDYWDSGAWRDRFSSAEYTRRQEAYARQLKTDGTYTPQVVVDGAFEFVGSNRVRANDVIAKSAMQSKGIIELKIDSGSLKASISGLNSHADATVYLAVAESGLSNKVSGGENSGVTLEHASVVRELKQIGSISGKQNEGTFDAQLPVNTDWKGENTRYVVFVQENSTLKILAVGQVVK